jgi:type IV secretory pathway VirB9-like protein
VRNTLTLAEAEKLAQRQKRLGNILIAVSVLGLIALMFHAFGCASQAQPPVVVQAAPTPAPKPIPSDPYASLPSDVAEAIKHNETPTLHHGITLVQPYSPDLQYPLNCQPLHVTQIRLRDDETTNRENVKVGDKDRWGTIIGDHTVLIFPLGTNTSITVPGAQVPIPADPHMVTNLVIHTSMGNDYVFNPVKIGKPFTEKVEFYYPDYVRALDAARKQVMQQEANR